MDATARGRIRPATSHLLQAQEHRAGLRRNLTHATETLVYNSAQPPPLATAS